MFLHNSIPTLDKSNVNKPKAATPTHLIPRHTKGKAKVYHSQLSSNYANPTINNPLNLLPLSNSKTPTRDLSYPISHANHEPQPYTFTNK